jgi:hypothetical protein
VGDDSVAHRSGSLFALFSVVYPCTAIACRFDPIDGRAPAIEQGSPTDAMSGLDVRHAIDGAAGLDAAQGMDGPGAADVAVEDVSPADATGGTDASDATTDDATASDASPSDAQSLDASPADVANADAAGACGGPGLPCCGGMTPCNLADYFCFNATCTRCIEPGDKCCPADTTHPQPYCGGGQACTAQGVCC